MHKSIITITFVAGILLAISAHSDEAAITQAQFKDKVTLTTALGAQLLFFIYSDSCSNVANFCGGVTALSVPWIASKSETITTAGWAAITGMESLALYNLSIDEDDYSRHDLLINNMLALNLTAAVSYLLLDDMGPDKSVKFAPLKQGGIQLVFNYRF